MQRLPVVVLALLCAISGTVEAGKGGGGFSSGGSSFRSSNYSSGRSSSPSYSANRGSYSPSYGSSSSRTTVRYSGTTSGGTPATAARLSSATSSRLFTSRIVGSSATGYRGFPGASYTSGAAYGARASGASYAAPAAASPALQRIIVQRQQDSGPGWLGTAALVYLLSRPELSTSDRAWVSNQMADQIDMGQTDSIDRTSKLLTFSYDGWPATAKVGDSLQVSVIAQDAQHRYQAISCSIFGEGSDNRPTSEVTDQGVKIKWTPGRAGLFILQCDGFAEGERRTIAVSN